MKLGKERVSSRFKGLAYAYPFWGLEKKQLRGAEFDIAMEYR